MAANVPLQDDTGQAILAELQRLTAAVVANTAQLACIASELKSALNDQQALCSAVQAGTPYVPYKG